MKLAQLFPTLAFLGTASLPAQTEHTWNPGSGSWIDPARWSSSTVPNAADADVRVDNATGTDSVLTFGQPSPGAGLTITVGRLRLDAGDRVEFNDRPNRLEFNDTSFAGAGALQLGGVLALPFASGTLSGSKTLTGAGRLVLGGPGQRPSVQGDTHNQAIIEGTAAFGVANSNRYRNTNSGLIDANVPGLDLDFHGLDGVDRSTNTGTMRSTNGGRLLFGQGEWLNNGGTLLASGTGSLTAFYRGGLIVGGTLSATGGGLLQVGGSFPGGNGGSTFRNLTIQGPSSIVQTLFLDGTVTNEGTMTVVPNGRIDAPANPTFDPGQTVTLAGGGQVILSQPDLAFSAFGYRFSRWLIQGQTIRGFGSVGDDDTNPPEIVNRGTFLADQNNQVLRLRLRLLDNQAGGLLRARDGGILRIATSGSLANTGGTIEALNGGRIEASFGRIEGGLLRNVGGYIALHGLTLFNPGSGMRLEGELTLGSPSSQQNARLVGDIENTGLLRVQGGGQIAQMLLTEDANRSVVLRGGGQLILGDPNQPSNNSQLFESIDVAFSPRTLTHTNHTIRGFGVIGNSSYDRWLVLENSGLVHADTAGQTLFVGLLSGTNAGGTYRASGGGRIDLYARGGFNNTGGTVEALSGSSIWLFATTITGGLVSTAAPSGKLEIPRELTAEGGVVFANAGTTELGVQGQTRVFNGLDNGGSSFINAGTIRKVGSGDYSLRTLLNSTGAMDVQAGILRNFGGGTITGGTQSAAAGTELTFQNTPGYTFAGINVFQGAGSHSLYDTTATLSDAATELRAVNFNVGNSTVSGPGLLSHSGLLRFLPSTGATISGSRLLTLPGATAAVEVRGQPFQFNNGATWENRGTIVFQNIFGALLNGAAGTLLDNTATGIVRGNMGNNDLTTLGIETRNAGRFDVVTAQLRLEKPSTWINGTATIAAGAELWIRNAPLTLQGTANASSGAGFLKVVEAATVVFDPGAVLTAERIQFDPNVPGMSGAGELRVTAEARFHPYSGTTTFSGTQVNLLSGSTSLIEHFNGTFRLQNGAALRNAGTLNFRRACNFELNSNALLENTGTMTVTSDGNAPVFQGDNTGLFRTTAPSVTRFYPSSGNIVYNVGLPFEFAGQVYADSGLWLNFDRGGIFQDSAKVWANHPASKVTFAGASQTYRVRGIANEFLGTGVVYFSNTRLLFEDPSGNPSDDPVIAAGARVVFENANTTLEGNGLLSANAVTFFGPVTLNGSRLQTFGSGETTNWNATNANLTLQNGARILNGSVFRITTTIGTWSGTPGTLFHNQTGARFVHESLGTSNIAIPFQNDGVLEFSAGTVNFTSTFSGTGGIAASNGARVTLPLGSTALNALPGLLQTTGAGSQIDVTLPGGDKLIRLDVNGGRLVAAGAGNIVAAGGLNMVAAGGGNIVAAGGLNLVAAGAGNITAQGINSVLQAGGLIGLDGGTMIGLDGGTLISENGLGLTNGASASLSGAGTRAQVAGLIGLDGSTLIGNDGSTIVAAGSLNLQNNSSAFAAGAGSRIEAAKMIGDAGSTLVGNDGASIVAAGGLNRPSGARPTAAGDPGSIVAATGAVLAGNGTFQGAGYIQANSFLRPGHSVSGLGAMTWTGTLTVESGGTLEIQLGGLTADTQHDRIHVSGAFVLNGNLTVSFTNGFGSTVGPADVFDIVVSQTSAASALAGLRVPVSGSFGSFAVQIVNGGKTLRLANYQIDPITFLRWTQRHGLSGPAAAPTADPFGSGLSNLLKYALGLDPTKPGGRGPTPGSFIDGLGNRYLTLVFTKPANAELPTDLQYLPERASGLNPSNWSASSGDVVPVGDPVPGPGNLQTVTVRSTHPIAGGHEFLRLRVTLP